MSLPFLNTAPGYDEELRNSVFVERGLHATSICGAVGAAVAVAMLQGQDEAGIASAAGIAASLGAGLLEANRTRGTVKRVHCGVAAADPARHGLTGPPTVLEGRFGFLRRSAATAPTRTPSSAAWARTGSCRA
jgi:2-methylcitrate dehydratase PrpD